MGGLAIGFFDGVHRGHQAILKGASAALTFRNHPLTVLAPERAPRLIMTCEERVAAIRACGVGDVTMLDFTRELADLPPAEFASRFLLASGRFSSVRCGANWRFGKGGAGDAALLRKLGIEVEVAPYAMYKDEKISSSRVRLCVEHGEIEDANAMMGRSYEVRGLMVAGKGLGRKLGYPTINLKLSSQNLKLPFGVYEVEVEGRKAVANYGLAPTMGDKAWNSPILEVHLLDDQAIEQADQLSVRILRFLRPERKFLSLADLQRQIAADCSSVRR